MWIGVNRCWPAIALCSPVHLAWQMNCGMQTRTHGWARHMEMFVNCAGNNQDITTETHNMLLRQRLNMRRLAYVVGTQPTQHLCTPTLMVDAKHHTITWKHNKGGVHTGRGAVHNTETKHKTRIAAFANANNKLHHTRNDTAGRRVSP